MTIPIKAYREILAAVPLLCVDVVLEFEGKFVLVKRLREPAKGRWWVPGGRVLKGETLAAAARRKMREELGIPVKVVGPLGYYEKRFRRNEFGLERGIHTVSIVMLAQPLSLNIKLDGQSSGWRLAGRLPRSFVVRPFGPGECK